MNSHAAPAHRPYGHMNPRLFGIHFPSNGIVALLIFIFVVATNLQFPINQTYGDAVWNLPTAFSLIYEGNIDLSEYQTLIDQVGLDYTLHYVDGTPYNTYPIGASLFAVPFAAAADWGAHLISVNLRLLSGQILLAGLDMLIASVTVAGTAAFLYLIARLYLANQSALLIAFIFAFCTSALSVVSRGLWQHGPSMLMLSISLYALLRARELSRFLVLSGFALAFAYIIRPTNSLSVIILSLYVLLVFRQKIILFVLGAALISLLFFYLNYTVYGQPFSPYFVSYFLPAEDVRGLVNGLLGNLISPNRGLFIFSPVLLFSLVGIGIKLRSRSLRGLDFALILIILLHWFLMSSYRNWYAGYSFGPRYMSDVLPYFAFFLIPFFANLPSLRKTAFYLTAGLLVITTFLSLAIHFRGASVDATQSWNYIPVSVDEDPSRVWNWSDMQFLRGLGEPIGSLALGPVSAHRFEFDEDTRAFENEGWGDVERFADGTSFQWTIEPRSSLTIRLVSAVDLRVEIGILRAISSGLLDTLVFSVNDHPVALHLVDGVYTGVIPVAALSPNGKPSEIQFTIDAVISPSSIEQSSDTRTLGLMVDYLDIYPLYEAGG